MHFCIKLMEHFSDITGLTYGTINILLFREMCRAFSANGRGWLRYPAFGFASHAGWDVLRLQRSNRDKSFYGANWWGEPDLEGKITDFYIFNILIL